jgi:hypothetical protein
VSGLVSLLRVGDESLSVLSVDSLCRLCVVPAVEEYVMTQTDTLTLLFAAWRNARDILKLSILAFFAKVAEHPQFAPLLLEKGALDDIISLGSRQQLKFRSKIAQVLSVLYDISFPFCVANHRTHLATA